MEQDVKESINTLQVALQDLGERTTGMIKSIADINRRVHNLEIQVKEMKEEMKR